MIENKGTPTTERHGRHRQFDRREVLNIGACALALGAVGSSGLLGRSLRREGPAQLAGLVEGEPTGAAIGAEVLQSGGNAVDAIVAAALTVGVISVHMCGIGGYGGHMVIALSGGRKVTAIDFNSMAPAAARGDMFRVDASGKVPGRANEFGWLAAGVPGTIAGMELALTRYGTRSFRELVAPAIGYAAEGFPVTAGLGRSILRARTQLFRDDASRRLFFRKGRPLAEGDTFRNPDLAGLLETLARKNSTDSFYRGDIARRIAAAFARHGGLVTEGDLAAYRAREVEPVQVAWGADRIFTAPLTAGGTTVLQALSTLKALKESGDLEGLDARQRLHARLELLRLAWRDRLGLFGDPEQVDVPVVRLLSGDTARRAAARVKAAVRTGKPLPVSGQERDQGGTIHLSAADRDGNLVALTMTHGNAFGARVTVDGLGLILGHGVSRFDPRPGRANSPGPRKRPLHNMCPTVITRGGTPVLALGGRGGRRIPNAVFDVVSRIVAERKSTREAVDAPRLHTEGSLNTYLDSRWRRDEAAYLEEVGFEVRRGSSAVVSAVSYDPLTSACAGVTR